ncbi:Sodium/hydrogen exchanger [Cryphonectria parasitica EP155]|uniref:Sodium/hydrogen exchanger n=1 Tax=Cryphonectria parasitica (strain ATCC 38755 / EP155) TaxID=660469 RepID=A0A9P4XY27_CRYP1|nr:Sodium/hydrogen exchanger [Cryphonectria parasitica EP155]KAF3763013.1 Sodium/hydrogen exchanger [Cryphonectria parasitica EP155]
MWSQLEPTLPHLTYLALPIFLIIYALFSHFIRNRLYLSEPPLAVLYGILLGPAVLNILLPSSSSSSSNNTGSSDITTTTTATSDVFTQELTRIVLGLQCFAVGIELPAHWLRRRPNLLSVLTLLGPAMIAAWAITALLAHLLFHCSIPTALLIGACLAPTDPVLAASVLGGSTFSSRVPPRLRRLLSAESASNDGTSFPFLYAGLAAFETWSAASNTVTTTNNAASAIRDWLLVTVLYQCCLGLALGLLLGRAANFLLRFSEGHGYAGRPGLVAFYLLLAVLSVGIGSTLGLDDFLLAFGAGVGFAHDGWFGAKSDEVEGEVSFRSIVDLVLDSSVFVYFGAVIPWARFTGSGGGTTSSSSSSSSSFLSSSPLNDHISVPTLILFLVLVLLLRRIPAILALHACHLIPNIKTFTEALFVGHFGPMGIGALFLAIEARAQLETGSSIPLPTPPSGPLYAHDGGDDDKTLAIALVWPVVSFVVLGSTMVHGLSVLGISAVGHFRRNEAERAPLLGGEREGLAGMGISWSKQRRR